MNKCPSLIFCAVLSALTIGCGSKQDETTTKAPRPVTVIELLETNPGRLDRYTGTVASWKTDQLGFEVPGLVEFVIEPESHITEAASGGDMGTLSGGTELARLDPTRYELSVESAKAQISAAEKQRDAAQIELDSVIPAQKEAAQAEFDLAKIEVNRNQKLVAERAGSQGNLDIAIAKLGETTAKLKQLDATREAKRAEVASLDANVVELQESLRQAQRDLANCYLRWSVPGQVAKVHVIPGSFVLRGEPVVTVQMMHPIKVEFEVSGATARALNHRDQVKVHIPQPDGTTAEHLAFIYTIDPIADPNTRTFTITLMLSNHQVRTPLPEELKGQVVARTDTIGKLIMGFGSMPNSLFVNQAFLQQDDEGHFVWKILNRRIGTLAQESQRVMKVTKVRVIPGETLVPVLGLADLREVKLADAQQLDPEVDLITGKIILPSGDEKKWSGDNVFYDVERWELLPGDLVGVDLPGKQTQSGFYVPIDAIMEKSGTNYVFVVEHGEDGDKVRQVQVTVHDPVGTLRRIQAVAGQQLNAGARIAAAGAVFLVDGDRVNVTEQVEVRR